MGTIIIPLDKSHDVASFTSPSTDLNRWLQTTARQHQSKSLSKTFVLIDTEQPTVVRGFYALAIRQMMPRDDMPPALTKRLPLNIPGYTLARLAVAAHATGHGYGADLLVDAIDKVTAATANVGGPFLFVDAKDLDAAAFYRHFGFTPFPSDPLTLVMSI